MESLTRRHRQTVARERLGMEHLEQRSLMTVVAGVPSLLPESDSGVSNRDRLTNVTTPTFLVRAPRVAGVTLLRVGDAEPLGTGVPGPRPGTWLVTSRQLEDGVHGIVAQADGSSQVSRPVRIEIRTVASAAAPTVALCGCTDSGVKGDGVTNAVAPRLVGGAPPRAVVTLALEGGPMLGTARATPRGQWAFVTRRNAIPEGTHRILATATDVFGNATGAGATTVTIDRQRPTAILEATGLDSFRVTFSKRVTGFTSTLLGMSFSGRPDGGRAFSNVPLSNPRLRRELGPIVFTPSADGRVYNVSFPDLASTSGSYTLRLSARGSRISDTVGNPLVGDVSVSETVA